MAEPLPSVYDYVDHRAFLRDWVAAKKVAQPTYSHRVFARRAGTKNPSLLGQVIRGRRNLTEATLVGFVRALKLDREQQAYFRMLVDLDRATSLDDRTLLVEQLGARRRYQGARRLEDEGFRYLSHWYFPAIRELAGRADFRMDPDWVGAQLRPQILARLAREALDTLLELGMIVATPDGGAQPETTDVVTGHDVASLAVRNYHRGMARLAADSLEKKGGPERHFGAVTVLVPSALVGQLKAEIGAFQERILALCESADAPGEVVMQLNLQLFPLSAQPDLGGERPDP